jgi:hypothetical protein
LKINESIILNCFGKKECALGNFVKFGFAQTHIWNYACLCNFNKLGCGVIGVIDLFMFSMEFGFLFSKYLDNRS